jgi:hypothetical protein
MLGQQRLTASGVCDQPLPEVWSDDFSNCVLT